MDELLEALDRLTGEQLVTYNAMLFGLDRAAAAERVADLLRLLDLDLGRARGYGRADRRARDAAGRRPGHGRRHHDPLLALREGVDQIASAAPGGGT